MFSLGKCDAVMHAAFKQAQRFYRNDERTQSLGMFSPSPAGKAPVSALLQKSEALLRRVCTHFLFSHTTAGAVLVLEIGQEKATKTQPKTRYTYPYIASDTKEGGSNDLHHDHYKLEQQNK